jgi:ankyrin repeat protein/predicted DNA-binding WGR domain protein
LESQPFDTVEIDGKYYRGLIAQAKKFVPPQSEAEEEEEESEEESEEEEELPKGRGAKKGSSAKKIVGSKSVQETPASTKKGKKAEVIEEEEESEEQELAKPRLKAKSNAGTQVSAKAKPAVFKRGIWNPNVKIVDKCLQLESDSAVPNFECSRMNSNREVIRAAQIGNNKLLEKIAASDHKISRLTEKWGVDNETNALKIILDSGDQKRIMDFLELLQEEKKKLKYGDDDQIALKDMKTGFNDKHAYGVHTRKVNVSRGGRQGNNAFLEDQDHPSNSLDYEHIEYLLSSKKTTIATLKTILSFSPDLENDLLNKVGYALRNGNREVADFLIQRGVKNGGYGLSEHYSPALMGKTVKSVADIKKISCTKKAHGMGNISPIHCACLNPNAEILKHILTCNPEYLNMDDCMRKPVHYAACCESVEPLKYLLSKNVDSREMDNQRTTPLMYAASAGRVDNVRFLLQNDRSIPAFKNRKGYNAIHYAAEYGHFDVVKLLVENGLKIDLPGPDRKTCLHIAAAKGNWEMVEFLVNNGAKTTTKDKYKRTALLLACKNGNLKIASFLLQNGAPYEEGDSSDNTPLHYACAYGYPEVIQLLFTAGANPNAVNSWNLTPTAVALLKSYFSCLRTMLNNPITNVNCIDDEGRTLVSNAVGKLTEANFIHFSFLLKDKKADPNIADSKGLTALDYLCLQDWEDLANADINSKSDMNLKEVEKVRAEKKNLYKKYFKLLLESGADVNHVDKWGLTPIMGALENANLLATELLLELKTIELNNVDEQQDNIVHYLNYVAGHKKFYEIAHQIIGRIKGADKLLNSYDYKGFTPVMAIFLSFSEEVDGLKSKEVSRLTEEVQLSKKQGVAEKEKKKKAGKKKKSRAIQRKAPKNSDDEDDDQDDEQSEGEDEEDDNSAEVTLSQVEKESIEKEATENAKYQVEQFIEFLRLTKKKGANPNLRVKKCKKSSKTESTEEEASDSNSNSEADSEAEAESEDSDDLDYGFDKYFEFFHDKINAAVNSKIDVPEKKRIPKFVGYSLLHDACACRSLPIYNFLIEEYKINTNVTSVYGESEILCFVRKRPDSAKNAEILTYLINKGLNLNISDYQKKTALLVAVELGKELFVKTLLEHKAFVDAQDINGNYPLLKAVINKNLKLVELLIKWNANPNLVDENGRNSMHWAVNLSNADADASNEIENALVNSGGDLNLVDGRGRVPLHYAFIKIGDPFATSNIDPIETVSNILSRKNIKVDVRDNWGNTPLNYAAQRGSVISGLYLLKNNADINNKNNDQNTPLNICLLNGHQNMCIFLIQKSADLKSPVSMITMKKKREELKNRKDEEENEKKKKLKEKSGMDHQRSTVKKTEQVEYQSSSSEMEDKEDEMVEEAIGGEGDSEEESEAEQSNEEEEDEESKESESKESESQEEECDDSDNNSSQGSNHNRGETSKALEQSLNVADSEKFGSTFSIAIRRNWQSVAFLMLEFGFDLSLAVLDSFNFRKYNYVYTLLLKKSEAGVYQMTNSKNQNLTHLFARNSSRIEIDLFKKIYETLQAKKLDFNSLDVLNRTAFHYAAQAGSLKCVKRLLPLTKDVNLTDKFGLTPLGLVMINSFSRAIDFVKKSQPLGLDINKKFVFEKKQHTALTFVLQNQQSEESFKSLVELGADLNLADQDGWTPLVHYVRMNRFAELQKYVKEYKPNTKLRDNLGRTIIHHCVNPREFGSYENVAMLKFLAKYADINQKDNAGHAPIYYAKMQESGVLSSALLSLKASDEEMFLRRSATSQLKDFEYPVKQFDMEADFNSFVEKCRNEAKNDKKTFDEKFPVDKHAKGNYEVCYDGDDPYHCYMVKVDISHGYYSANTFYNMQILRERVRDVYILFTRWGRVGTSGQYQQTPFSKIDDARKEFCSIFKSKSGNLWEDRHQFAKQPKKYRLVPYEKKTKFENYIKAFNYTDSRIPASKVSKPLFRLMRRLCNFKIFSQALKNEFEMSEDIIQSLTRERILDAEAVLGALSKAIADYSKARNERNLEKMEKGAEELNKLTNEFYELIPNEDYEKEAIPAITSESELGNLQKMIKDLIHFEIVVKLIGASTFNQYRINPIDYIYNSLDVKIMRVQPSTDEFKIIS